jgi:hypothetical protein
MQSSSRGARAALTPGAALKLLRIALVALPLFALFAPKQAHAYAWMIKRGYPSCPACHADPSGGELLTAYGRMISTLTLSTNWSGEEGAANEHGLNRRFAKESPEEQRLLRKIALRSPESFAAHAKGAGEKAGDAPADKAGPAEGDTAEGEAKADGAEGEEKAAGEGEAKEGEAAASTEAAAPAASSDSGGGDSGESKFPNFMFGAFDLPDWLLLGGSYRHLNILPVGGEGKFRTFPMMLDIYGMAQFGGFKVGGSIGGAKVAAGSPYARRAQVTANQGDQWNLISRTHYIGYDILPELTVRAGRLNLPFGVRIPEHTMWVRQATNTDRESSQQHGVAIAYVGEKLRGEVMGIAGNYQVKPDKYRDRGYSGYLEYQVADTATVGVSSLMTTTKVDRATNQDLKTIHQVHGAMARAGFGEKFAILAEVDGIFTSRRDAGYVGFAQFDAEAIQGVHILLTGELLDQGYPKPIPGATTLVPRAPGEGKPKVGGWFSVAWFVYSHFDVRFDAIKRTDEDVQLLAQLHVYL